MIRGVCLALVLGALAVASIDTAHGATFAVTKTADTNDGTCDSDCSLREAIVAANAAADADTINVPAGAYTLTIAGMLEDAGATGDLDITESVTITGAGLLRRLSRPATAPAGLAQDRPGTRFASAN